MPDDETTGSMIALIRERGIDPNSHEAVALALLNARFRAAEINDRIEAVMAGARISGTHRETI